MMMVYDNVGLLFFLHVLSPFIRSATARASIHFVMAGVCLPKQPQKTKKCLMRSI